MSSITTPKTFRFPMNTRHGSRKALLGVNDEMEVYYSGGVAYLKSSGLGEFYAKGRKVLKLVDGGVDVIGKLYLNGVELSSVPGTGGSVAWADITGTPPTYAPSSHDHDDRYYTETEINAWFELTGTAPNQYIRCKFPFAGDYEIQAWSDTGWLPPSIWDSIPLATSSSVGGLQLGSGSALFLREDGTWQTVMTGSSMVYPGAGIALSTGSAWDTPITNNSANWNTAYGWGNHASAGYLTSQTSHADVLVDGDFTSQGIMLRGASAGVYSILTNNSTNWNTAYGWGDHAGLYAPAVHNHDDRYFTETEFSAWFELTGSAPNQYIRCKFPFAGDYEIQAWSDTGWLPPTIWESLPAATTSSLGGIQLGSGSSLFLREDGTWAAASGGTGLTQQQIEGLI